MAERDDDGARQGREFDHGLRLELLLRVPHGVAQDQSPLGVGVDDLDGLARHRLHHVTRTLGIAVRHVLDQGADGDDVGLGLAPGDQTHGPGDGAGTAHVPLHVFHAASGLQRNATGIEGDTLADQRDRRLVLRAVHPAHDQELRLALAALADSQQDVHAELLHFRLAQHLDLHAELGELPGAAGELDGVKHIGRLAHEVAGKEDGVDGGLKLGIGLARFRRTRDDHGELLEGKLLLRLVLGLVLVEAVVAQAGTQREVSRDLARRQAAALHRIHDHGHCLMACLVRRGRNHATQAFRGAGIEFTSLAHTQQHQAGNIAGMPQDGQGLVLGTGEAASFEGPHERATGLRIRRLRCRQELFVGGHEHRNVARKSLRKG